LLVCNPKQAKTMLQEKKPFPHQDRTAVALTLKSSTHIHSFEC
jgi:hypothetical protein